MSKLEALKLLFDRVMDDVFRLSDNYLMTIPKKGSEVAWRLEKELATVLDNLIHEMEP